jgi:ribonuclease Z
MIRFSVCILGSGSALPIARRNPSGQLITYNNEHYLVDCGEGTQLRMRHMGARFQRITHIFISHLHGDHYLGLVGLLSTMHLLGRTADLHLHAPGPLKEIIDLQLRVSDTRLRFTLHFHPLQTTERALIAETNQMQVYAFPLAHRIPTWGFQFCERPREGKINKAELERRGLPLSAVPGLKSGHDYTDDRGIVHRSADLVDPPLPSRSYAYCSDTAFAPHVAEFVKGSDVLYHESTFLDEHAHRAKETFHSTARQAAEIAALAGVGKLVMGHYSARYKDLAPFAEEASAVFSNVVLAEDGMDIAIVR